MPVSYTFVKAIKLLPPLSFDLYNRIAKAPAITAAKATLRPTTPSLGAAALCRSALLPLVGVAVKLGCEVGDAATPP